tara:strand:+ start:14704 stop:15081 length:378 start_codon:yes stop_codon:yes gene_type:complete
VLKTYSLLITLVYSFALAAVCLIQINGLSEVKIPNADKIFHFFSYAILVFLWYITLFYKFKLNKSKSIIYTIVISIMFGIIIEVLQGCCTGTRQADIKDIFANTLGALFATLLIYIKNRILIKKI